MSCLNLCFELVTCHGNEWMRTKWAPLAGLWRLAWRATRICIRHTNAEKQGAREGAGGADNMEVDFLCKQTLVSSMRDRVQISFPCIHPPLYSFAKPLLADAIIFKNYRSISWPVKTTRQAISRINSALHFVPKVWTFIPGILGMSSSSSTPQ